jgi:hypothetical protein
MTQRSLPPVQDGDQGPIYRFPVRDGAGYRDMATAAVELYLEDEDGNSLGVRPGVVVSPKNSGQIDVMMKGRETDWGDGRARSIVIIPKFYYAQSVSAAAVPSSLTNTSFDTDTTPADGIADGWTVAPATTGTYAIVANDSAPPSIFGSCQSVNPNAGTATEYLYQDVTPGGTIAPGTPWAAGVWYRGNLITGAASDGHALSIEIFQGGTLESVLTRFPVGTSDWRFITAAITAAQANNTKARFKLLLNNSNLGSRRFDEAFLFPGRWWSFFGERIEVPITPRSRVPKTVNQIQGVGSFERDSNADGLADGYTKVGSANTYSIEQDPANVAHDRKSQKVVLANGSTDLLRILKRGKFASGDVWAASVKVKTLGALSGAGGGAGFKLTLRGDDFSGGATQETASTNFGTNLAVFTTYTAQITLLADRSVVRIEIALAGYTGTVWIDDQRLWRVSP